MTYIHDMPCLTSAHLPQSDIQPFTVSRFVKSTWPKMQSSSSNPQLWNSWNPSRIRYNISFVHQKSLSFPNYETVITKTLKPPGFQTKPYCIQFPKLSMLSTVLEDPIFQGVLKIHSSQLRLKVLKILVALKSPTCDSQVDTRKVICDPCDRENAPVEIVDLPFFTHYTWWFSIVMLVYQWVMMGNATARTPALERRLKSLKTKSKSRISLKNDIKASTIWTKIPKNVGWPKEHVSFG